MGPLLRNPEIIWRVEKRREQEVLQTLEQGEDASELGTVILIISGMMHQLNLVGGKIWSLCDGSRGQNEVVDALAADFEVEREVLAQDVQDFIDDLLKRGWLTYG